jgi:hypothetical protein
LGLDLEETQYNEDDGHREKEAQALPHRRLRSGSNWLATGKSAEIVGECFTGKVAIPCLLAETFEADGLQVARNPRPEMSWRYGLLGAHLLKGVQHCLAPEGRLAGQALI